MGVRTILALCVIAVMTVATRGQEQAPPGTEPAPVVQADVAAGHEAFGREDWEGAVAAYEAALAKGQDRPLVHFRLGYALHVLKRYEEALEHHVKATAIPNPALKIDALYNVACAQALLGRKAEALAGLKRAVEAGFKDGEQLAKDTDLDALRGEAEFKAIEKGIAEASVQKEYYQAMDFFVGSWQSKNEQGEVTENATVSRPLSGSRAILTTITNIGGGKWAGMLIPNPVDQTWQWASADGDGNATMLTGKPLPTGGVAFEGREASSAGLGAWVRLRLTPQGDGTARERVEVSEDGKAWRVHHDKVFRKVE